MLRHRDILSAIAILFLSSTAWNEQTTDNSIAASLRLAFYLPRPHHDNDENASQILPAILDIDGDGTPEALAMWTTTTPTSSDGENMTIWKVQVLDLRPSLLHSRQAQIAPFQPKVLLESEAIQGFSLSVPTRSGVEDAVPFQPLQMITGQVLTSRVQQQLTPKKESAAAKDKSLHYFCGSDWHDASQKCQTHCPSGLSSDCPNNEKCFADTPCIQATFANDRQGQDILSVMGSLHTTPAGGWPSVFTAWSQGRVTMHSLTAEQPDSGAGADTADKQKNKKKSGTAPLQVKRMWDVTPLLPLLLPEVDSNTNNNNKTTAAVASSKIVEWEMVSMTFVDALSAPTNHGSNAGMLVVTGKATVFASNRDDDDNDAEFLSAYATFVVALDALTGKTLWQSSSSNAFDKALSKNHKKDAQVLLPVVPARGSTSVARRRSFVPGLSQQRQKQQQWSSNSRTASVNCMHEYRRSLLTSGALPYQYWGSEEDGDATVAALHFDHQSSGNGRNAATPNHARKKKNAMSKLSGASSSRRRTETVAEGKNSSKSWFLSSAFSHKRKQRQKTVLKYGRPNVIVTHNHDGIQVRALRNGRSLCHLSLHDRTLYTDINHDGTLDSLQVITSQSTLRSLRRLEDGEDALDERQWVESLARRVYKDAMSPRLVQTPLCHLLALSGLPTKEELFSVNLCGRGSSSDKRDVNSEAIAAAQQLTIQGAPLLVVEPSSGVGARGYKGHDVIAAVNTGTVSRFRGNNGRRLWQMDGKQNYQSSDFPTWHYSSIVVLGRIDSEKVIPSTRPIVLAGENSVALLAASSGHILALSTFPQPSTRRPRLVDLNGDGTTDLLVCTKDAIWGYHVVVRTGTSVPFRIIVGLLIMGLMLALLRNRFGPHPGKRSTDL